MKDTYGFIEAINIIDGIHYGTMTDIIIPLEALPMEDPETFIHVMCYGTDVEYYIEDNMVHMHNPKYQVYHEECQEDWREDVYDTEYRLSIQEKDAMSEMTLEEQEDFLLYGRH